MVVGFNHNFSYKGAVYHIQTEDSGRATPHIITLLYRGGNILSSKKTSYADIIKVNDLEKVVEDLMKEQHKDMLRRLKSGEFDDLIAKRYGGVQAVPGHEPAPATEEKETIAPVVPSPEEKLPPRLATPVASSPTPPAEESVPPKPKESALDDIILSYLVGED